MKTTSFTTSMLGGALVLPLILVGCGTGQRDRLATDRYDSDKHVTSVTDGARDINVHKKDPRVGPSPSRKDTQAMREQLEFHRQDTAQAADAATNEMPTGKDLPGPKVDPPAGTGIVEQERTVVIVPNEPRDQGEVALRQDVPGSETVKGPEIARYEADFRKNFEKHYADSGYGYDQYRPAYHYGYELAKDPRYQGMDWNAVESKAHGNWNENQMGPWDRYRDAVRYAWQRVREGQS